MGKGFGTGPIVELAYNLCTSKKKKKRLLEDKEPDNSLGALVLQSPITSLNGVLCQIL
jgi:hypothetical protein